MFRLRCGLVLLGGLAWCGFSSGEEAPGGAAPRKTEGAPPAIAAGRDADPALTAEGVAFFEKKIRPVLVAECYTCHSPQQRKKVRGGLALDTRAGLRKGGDTGPVLEPG